MTALNPAAQSVLAEMEREDKAYIAAMIKSGGAALVIGRLSEAFDPNDFGGVIDQIMDEQTISPGALIVGFCWWMAMLSVNVIARGQGMGPQIATALKERYAINLDHALRMPQQFYLIDADGNLREATLQGLMQRDAGSEG